MCGIGGELSEGGRQPDRAALERMSLAMRERGPDDQGLFEAEGIGLVHRRLSILDLTEAGRCPISNRDGSIQVVHNGEIYNFAELRQELEGKGHVFQSQGDSEVVVHGYREWGEALFSRLEGMFAIAIWDARRRRLILARDRFGKKPLYLLRKPDQLVFASTLNALYAHQAGDLQVNQEAMECYLSHGFIPHPHTIWQRVESFPPAHYGVIEGKGDLRMQPYWQFSSEDKRRISTAEAEEQIDEIIDRSVRRRLVADVPVGGFLSGGVDSSLVMARAAAHLPRVDTFSIGFEEAEFSELPYARQVADHIGSNHPELVLDVSAIYESLPDLVWQYGQPFGDSSAIPTHLVSRLARKDVTVSLSGDGGDESFAGYWRAEAGMYADYLRRLLPEALRNRALPSLVGALNKLGQSSVADRLDRLALLASGAPGASYSNNQSWFDSLGELKGAFFQDNASDHDLLACRVGKAFPGGEVGALRQLLYDDFQVQLPDAYLVKVDVASMAASL
ncbi:MAG: asparagine synthase (glutamine-hydrolyzing), partial [Myxococcota bacterium]|nr:asparagine synthase (glutamine-hydrolyzing) [Myxococcota bacterium]